MCCLVQVMCSVVCEVTMSEFKVENSSTPGNYTFAAVKGTETYRRSGNFRVIKFSCFKFSRKNIFVVQDTHENF